METQDGSTRKIYGLRHMGAVGVQQLGENKCGTHVYHIGVV